VLDSDPPCARRRGGARALQLFYSFFKTLIGKEVVVELKNGEGNRAARQVACSLTLTLTCSSACVRAQTWRSAGRFTPSISISTSNFSTCLSSSQTSSRTWCAAWGQTSSLRSALLTIPRNTAPRGARFSPLVAPRAQQSVKHCFVRGSVIRYAQLPKADVDVELLQDATRKEAQQQRAAK